MKEITSEDRKQFNKILRGIDAVLINNIVNIDESVYENWEDESPFGEEDEVFQWYAINSGDADWLKRHNQYITYSDKLDVYFWAITHFGTAWDYVDSMVRDFLEMEEE